VLFFCGCDTWSVKLSEEKRLRVFEKRVQKKTRGLKRNEITVGCKKLHNVEHNDLHSSPDTTTLIKKEDEMGRVYGTYWKEEKCL
jgi:hypothetical protein